jgi:predicted MFS family arabinose efflux permease
MRRLSSITASPVRRALLALALGGFGIGTGEFVMLGLLPNVAHDEHVSIPQAGHLISAYALGVVSYIAPMMTHLAGYKPSDITPLLVLFGIGMTAGNLIGAPLADRWGLRTLYVAMGSEIVVAIVFVFAAHNKITAALMILLFPFCSLAMLPVLQSRIVTLAGGAPNLAAASIQAAFNIANSLGAWLGGLTIAAGLGYGSVNVVAAGLAGLGLAIAVYSGRLDHRRTASGRTALPLRAGAP